MNLGKSFDKLKLVIEIENEVDKRNTILGNAIKVAMKRHAPVDEILSWVRSQAHDDRIGMIDVIGESLTDKILNDEWSK